jgi:hypothetical protein
LTRFLDQHARWIHALEINGFRSWQENQTVIELAENIGKPIISGGDRHCCQSNTMVNITDAASFDEFVAEIRLDRFSRIAVTAEYHLSLPVRQYARWHRSWRTSNFPVERRLVRQSVSRLP